MTKSRLPVSTLWLVLSAAGHAGAFAGVLLLGGGYGEVAARPGDGGSGTLWVSLVREAPPRAAGGPLSAAERSAPAPLPASGPALPAPPRSAPVARAAVPVPAALAQSVEPAPEAESPREMASAAPLPGPATSAAPSATDPAPRLGPGASAAPARAAGSAGRAGPDWPGPGEVDRAARPRGPIRPVYPARARRSGEQATVVVEAWVDEAGAVAFASVLRSGGSDFDASAQRAVRRSAFRPARLDGRDVASRVALRIHFQLYD